VVPAPFFVGWGVAGLFVSGFLAAPIMHVSVCGVCGTGLLFENYIVDASIFYKKNFPRICTLICRCLPFGVVVVVFMVLSKLLLDLLWSSF